MRFKQLTVAMAPKREMVDPAYDTLALSESDDDLDSEEIEDAPVCDDPHAALRRVSSAFDAKVAHLLSPGLAPPDATALTLDAEVTSRLNAARAMLSKVKRALLGPFKQMIESKSDEAAQLEEARAAEQRVLLERLTAQSKGVDEELSMLADAAGLRSVCDLYAAAEDEEIEARARRDKSRA